MVDAASSRGSDLLSLKLLSSKVEVARVLTESKAGDKRANMRV